MIWSSRAAWPHQIEGPRERPEADANGPGAERRCWSRRSGSWAERACIRHGHIRSGPRAAHR